MKLTNEKTSPSYAFGPFVLSGPERVLRRGDEIVSLTPKVIETLFVLIENPGSVLTKDFLMETLWPDAFVEESSLAQNISLLRKALGNGQSDQIYVETISKRGYRFVAEVREIAERVELPATSERREVNSPLALEPSTKPVTRPFPRRVLARLSDWKALTAVFCLLVIAIAAIYWWRTRATKPGDTVALKSVAVLPFKTVGSESETELWGLGMADSVILKLAGLEHVTVLPTSTVFKYKTGDKNVLSIGRELGVDAVLEGTVQRLADQVRVTAQLITVSDGKTVWSGKFDEKSNNVFCLQDTISELLAEELRLQVLKRERKSQSRPITRDAEAYQSYLAGLDLWHRRSAENLPKAIQHFQQAVTRDPNFALAHAFLADSYYVSRSSDQDAGAMIRKAEAAATKAIELDESLAEAHTVLAGVLASKDDGNGAAKEYKRALTLDPNYATAHLRYSYFLLAILDREGALHEARRAQELDPNSPITNGALGFMLMIDRRDEESLPYLDRSLELNPNSVPSRVNRGLAHLHCGRYQTALAEFSSVAGQDPFSSQMNLALANARLGRHVEARKLISDAISSSPSDQADQATNYSLLTVYSALGDYERAFAVLRKSSFDRMQKALLKFDPDLDSLRARPEFDAILNARYTASQPTPNSNSHSANRLTRKPSPKDQSIPLQARRF
ncbi:MAG TPA: winged helix-turn-helix domain-containing protein [Pyrinomonadaceae bacterium]|nr:winged helix-turn-helix domain-containing protein [Pyrinomonadaceae bacterium]